MTKSHDHYKSIKGKNIQPQKGDILSFEIGESSAFDTLVVDVRGNDIFVQTDYDKHGELCEACGIQEASDYHKFFKNALERLGAKSPADLKGKMKSKFFNWIDSKWKSKEETNEAEYQGKDVELNKPSYDSGNKNHKFKVYVTHPETGKVTKVGFGSPSMEIRRDNDARRKSFRARHKCDKWNFNDHRHTARFWSCKFWEKDKTVSDLVTETRIKMNMDVITSDDKNIGYVDVFHKMKDHYYIEVTGKGRNYGFNDTQFYVDPDKNEIHLIDIDITKAQDYHQLPHLSADQIFSESKEVIGYDVIQTGGSIGSQHKREPEPKYKTKEEAKEHAKSMNKMLSPGEKKYYGIRYKVIPVYEARSSYKLDKGSNLQKSKTTGKMKNLPKSDSKPIPLYWDKEKGIASPKIWDDDLQKYVIPSDKIQENLTDKIPNGQDRRKYIAYKKEEMTNILKARKSKDNKRDHYLKMADMATDHAMEILRKYDLVSENQLKKTMKSISRAAKGWNPDQIGIVDGKPNTPAQVVKRVKTFDDEFLMYLLRPGRNPGKGSPADLQMKAARIEAKRRGLIKENLKEMKESDILYEFGDHFIIKQQKKKKDGSVYTFFEVYKNTLTHSVKVATISRGNDLDKAFELAKKELHRREEKMEESKKKYYTKKEIKETFDGNINEIIKDIITTNWNNTFSNSAIIVKTSNFSDKLISVLGTLGKGKEEYKNGIRQNDPLNFYLQVELEDDGTIKSSIKIGYLTVNPKDKFHAYGSEKLGLRSFKTKDIEKFRDQIKKIFEKIKMKTKSELDSGNFSAHGEDIVNMIKQKV